MTAVITASRPVAAMTAPARMPALSHCDHFRFGYDGAWFVERHDAAQSWTVSYGRSTREPGDWRSECIATARLIREATDLDLWVLMSGGIDSEVVAQAFLFADIPFRAAITRFRDDLNRHDITWAVRFCEAHGVAYRLLDLDIARFFTSGAALDYAAATSCVQPQLLHTMWAMDQVEGYPILGSGECYLERRMARIGEPDATSLGGIWEMLEKERIASWYRHLMHRDRTGCAGFFQFNPENMLAFLRDPALATLCTDRGPPAESTSPVKAAIYRRHFLLEPRPKYHGFENVLYLDDALRPELERRFAEHNAVAYTGYAQLLRDLAP